MKKMDNIKFHEVASNLKRIYKVIEAGNLYVCRFHDGTCVLVSKEEHDCSRNLRTIISKPNSSIAMDVEMNRQEFEELFDNMIVPLSWDHFEFVQDKINLIDYFMDIVYYLEQFSKEYKRVEKKCSRN